MEHSGFFNSSNGDRKYKASDFADYFNSLITNGIFPNPSTDLQVIAENNNMTVTVKAGKAWINGYIYYNDSDLILPVDVADGTLNRIDRVVVKLDTTGRIISVAVKKGTFASSPAAPVLQRDADAYELGIADIAINAGITSILQSNITDQRQNSDLCGIVNSLIKIDSATLFLQFTDAFNSWFATIKNTLNGDTAGNLLNIINGLAGDGRTDETVKGVSDALKTHQSDNLYQTASGTATAITLTIGETLTNGFPITFIASADNSGSATTVNGKNLYKPGTTTAPTLKSGKAYTIWYNLSGDCFFIKASATGTVTPNKVLAGETFSNEGDTDLVGTRDESQLTTDNIRKNITIAGVTGNLEPRGYASGSFSTDSGTVLSIRGLSFKPKVIEVYTYDYHEKQVYTENGILNDVRYTDNSVSTGCTCTVYDDGFDINIDKNPGYTYIWRAWY